MKHRIPSLLITLIYSAYTKVIAQEGPGIVIAHPGQDVELLCNVTSGVPSWRVNNDPYPLSDLFTGQLAGHNSTGSNIIVEDIMMNDDRNGSIYICFIPQTPPTPDIVSSPTILYVAGVPSMVQNITIDNIFYILSWGEPFNNLDPIVSYNVSCLGDVTCPPNFATTDNTTRSYTITNLTTMTNYTFSVVATNSVGSGEAGVMMITTPQGIPDKVPNVMVPNVMIYDGSIRINGNNVTVTLIWGKPSSYFSPIMNYTVSCSGNVTCPANFTTNDTTTRNYTITNLTAMTNYTFSVVATNSIGNGEAGIVNTTTPAISQVIGVTLRCGLVVLITKCTVTWNEQENITRYLVNSNVEISNNYSVNTTLTFYVYSLPEGAESGVVTVNVTAMNDFGLGPSSKPVNETINVPSHVAISGTFIEMNPDGCNFLINVNCNISLNSPANMCLVMIDTESISINASQPMKVNEVECNRKFNIILQAQFTNGTMIGARLRFNDTTAGSCSFVCCLPCVIVTVIGSLVGAILIIIIIIIITVYLFKKKRSNEVEQGKNVDNKKRTDDETTQQLTLGEGAQPMASPTQVNTQAKQTDTEEYAVVDKSKKNHKSEDQKEKKDTQEQYAPVDKSGKKQKSEGQKEGGINYAELELQKGPKTFGDPGHIVAYGEVTGTNL